MKKTLKTMIFVCFAVVTVVFSFICTSAVSDCAPDTVQPDATATIKELNIIPEYSILQGNTLQMRLEESDEFILFNSVEWSSSNPNVISCAEDGKITGLKEGRAKITVKAKVGKASDSITVYCAKKLNNPKSSRINLPIAVTFRTPRFWDIQAPHFNMFDFLPLFVTEKLQVKGVFGSYFYVEFERNETKYKGFIFQNWMPDNIATDEIFKQLSTYDLDVFVNIDKDQYKVTTNYKGAVDWKVSDESIIDFNETTGKVKGKAPGTATISATVGNKTLVCTVHSIYDWPLDWTGAARQETCVYDAKGNTYEKTSDTLAVGEKFTVKGDMGGNSSWAYGVSEDGTWGFIPISHISTKNTISYYNGLNGRWPVNNMNIKKISSPFGPRSSDNGGNHKGFDIVANNPGEIAGKSVVSSFNGTVMKIYIDNNKETSHGNAIVITTNKIDPVSGKNLTVIYMHLSKWDTNSSGNIVINGKVLKEGDSVTKEQIIGYAGNTGYNTSGAHLHYEVNNQNAAIRSGSNNPFTETINPIFFYMDIDDGITKSKDCEAATNGNGFYWYGENE